MKGLTPPPKPQLPPIRVEVALFLALKRKAKKEGRTVSDVMRCAMRDGLAAAAAAGSAHGTK